jgi:hypothetical protein
MTKRRPAKVALIVRLLFRFPTKIHPSYSADLYFQQAADIFAAGE